LQATVSLFRALGGGWLEYATQRQAVRQ
jgi:hypothetical protein